MIIVQAYALGVFTTLSGFAVYALIRVFREARQAPRLPRMTVERLKSQRLDIGPAMRRSGR